MLCFTGHEICTCGMVYIFSDLSHLIFASHSKPGRMWLGACNVWSKPNKCASFKLVRERFLWYNWFSHWLRSGCSGLSMWATVFWGRRGMAVWCVWERAWMAVWCIWRGDWIASPTHTMPEPHPECTLHLAQWKRNQEKQHFSALQCSAKSRSHAPLHICT